MNCRVVGRSAWLLLLLFNFGLVSKLDALEPPLLDIGYFLRRLRTVDHLPKLERSHTALASTWDRTGGNADGTDFKRIEGATNILLDVDGPGCVHRLFTGGTEPGRPDLPGYLRVDGTRLQVLLDGSPAPLFDYPVVDFFDPAKGPVPAPLAGGKANGWTYPGCLLPIPYARHCRIQLVNPLRKNWGSYWQVAYTTFYGGVRVRSLVWPLAGSAQKELEAVCRTWQGLALGPPAPLGRWTKSRSARLPPERAVELRLAGSGCIQELRVSLEPPTPQVLHGVRLRMYWDGASQPSVDVPVGYFFGHAETGHAEAARFSTLVLGVTAKEAYTRFPMPFAHGAVIVLHNGSGVPLSRVHVALKSEKLRCLPSDWGRFHATCLQAPAALETSPRFGLKQVPGHLVLERQGRGKYVGVVLRTNWPHEGWWGEGDWLIWTDETGWPPSYHGTGTEEYFNSGWCKFDRKAISGYVAVHPGHPTEYSFHLNDAFQFEHNVKVAVETVGWDKADELIRQEHPVWGSTAFWYALPAQPAGSSD